MFSMMILLSICTSCRKDSSEDDPFRLLYSSSTPPKIPVSRSSAAEPVLTLSAHSMPFSVLSRVISDKFDIGLVFSEQLYNKTITAEFKKTSLSDVLNVVSRAFRPAGKARSGCRRRQDPKNERDENALPVIAQERRLPLCL